MYAKPYLMAKIVGFIVFLVVSLSPLRIYITICFSFHPKHVNNATKTQGGTKSERE